MAMTTTTTTRGAASAAAAAPPCVPRPRAPAVRGGVLVARAAAAAARPSPQRPPAARRAPAPPARAVPLRGPAPVAFFFGGNNNNDDGEDDEVFTVAKLQVGVFGPVARFQKELERIARVLEGRDDDEAMAYVVREISILLARKAKYCAYGSCALKFTPDLGVAERKFNAVALEERAKVRQETFSVRGARGSRAERAEVAPGAFDDAPDVGLDQWLCVTLVFCAEGRLNLGKVRTGEDLARALKVAGSVRSRDVVAVELLWTPEAEGDHYSKDELLAEHPTMATF